MGVVDQQFLALICLSAEGKIEGLGTTPAVCNMRERGATRERRESCSWEEDTALRPAAHHQPLAQLPVPEPCALHSAQAAATAQSLELTTSACPTPKVPWLQELAGNKKQDDEPTCSAARACAP